jgi:hypothetical protein
MIFFQLKFKLNHQYIFIMIITIIIPTILFLNYFHLSIFIFKFQETIKVNLLDLKILDK